MMDIERAAAVIAAARTAFADADSLASATQQDVVDLLTITADLARLVDAQRIRLAGEVAKRSVGADDDSICRRLGKTTARAAVAAAFSIRGGEASALLSLAAATSSAVSLTGQDIAIKFPRVASALDDGTLSFAQARAIIGSLEPASPRADLEQLAWAEGCLVDAATDADAPLVPELLVTQARAYVAVLDPDGVLPNSERQRALRSLRMKRRADGMWELFMLCPAEAGAAIKALLDAYTGPRVHFAFSDDPCAGDDATEEATATTDGSESEEGAVGTASSAADDRGREDDSGEDEDDAAEPSLDDRSPEQKRHDVILGLVQAHAASGDAPTVGGEAPVLMFTGTIEAYAAYLNGTEHPDRALTIEHTGDIVPIETVGTLLCDSFVQHVIQDERRHPLELGRQQRLFNRWQRRALAKRDGGCITPGCGMPVAWTQTHHVVPWHLGGKTDVDNGVLLCGHCHHEVHSGRLRIIGTPGRWRVVAELRPSDRYARATRRSAPLTAAATAPAPLAVKLPEPAAPSSAPQPAAPPVSAPPVSAPPASAPRASARTATRPTRRRDRSVEARLRRRLRAGPRSRCREPRIDFGPPRHIVLRT